MSHRRSFVLGIMLGAIATGCGDASRAVAPPPPPVVKVETVVQRDVPISAEWVGSLVGYINAQIRARVAGHLMSQNYTEGSVVKAGDLLFQVDPRTYQAAVDQAEANLLQAESQLSQAKAQVSASQAQVEQALAKVAQDEAQVKRAEADQRRTELDVARYTPLALTAPPCKFWPPMVIAIGTVRTLLDGGLMAAMLGAPTPPVLRVIERMLPTAS
jgi:membrane fusion protein (multidrug efflux system)